MALQGLILRKHFVVEEWNRNGGSTIHFSCDFGPKGLLLGGKKIKARGRTAGRREHMTVGLKMVVPDWDYGTAGAPLCAWESQQAEQKQAATPTENRRKKPRH